MVTHLAIDELTDKFRVRTRAKMHDEPNASNWTNWFVVSVINHVEASSYGPCPVEEVEWIEVDPLL